MLPFLRNDYIRGLKEGLEEVEVLDLMEVTEDAKEMWDSGEYKDDYNQRAKEKRDEYNREAAERGVKKEKKPHDQSRIKTRCSPMKIWEIMEAIKDNGEKKRAVEEMGFGALKNIPNMKLAHKLIEKLLHKFDTTSCPLFGVEVSVEVVGKLLGIPSKGKAIPQSISITKSNELGAKYKNKTLSQLGDDIKNMERIHKTFKEAFLLYILGHFLCPIVKNQPSQELYYTMLALILGLKGVKNILYVGSVWEMKNWIYQILKYSLSLSTCSFFVDQEGKSNKSNKFEGKNHSTTNNVVIR